MAWSTKTLEDMERTAQEESDGVAAKSYGRSQWLEVIFYGSSGPTPERYKYVWKGKQITRDEAAKLF